MSKDKPRFLFFVFFFLVLGFASIASAELDVSASVDRTTVSMDEFLNLTIKIEGLKSSLKSPKVKLPSLEENFAIVATSQSNSYSFSGGESKVIWQLQYTLLPQQEGEIRIGKAEVIYRKKVYSTEEIVITVTPSKNPQRMPRRKTPLKKVPWSKDEGTII
ncbi:BatD family protein [Thermoproteota archaeon]